MTYPSITTLSALSIVPSTTNPNNGFYPPNLTQTQINAIPANTVQYGGIVYNSTTGFLQTYTSGDAWVNLELTGGAAGDVVVSSHAINPVTNVTGTIYYNTADNVFVARTTAAWETLYQTTDALGNLVVPVVANAAALPAAPANGMIVYQTDLALFKVYNGAWNTLVASSSAATGVGLTNGAPLTIPSGPSGSVEVAANQVSGFLYYNTTVPNLRIWFNGAWATVTVP
jgi:hypothetical protein